MAKLLFISNKDNNFYNFRSEKILKLRELGHEIVLLCPYGKKIDYFTDRGCRFIGLAIDRRGTNPFADLVLTNNYVKILKKEKPDVVLTYTTKSSVYGGIACRLTKTPYIVNNAGLIESSNYSWYVGYVLDMLYKIGFGGAACMMYQNHQERDYVNRLLKNKIHYRDIPGSGVNLKDFVFKPYPENDSQIIFNYVARVVKIKGIDEYLECAKVIKEKYPHTEFRIFGDFDDDAYREIITGLEKQGIVKYMGIQMNMRPFIEECHAAIHPSYYEGMTNVVLEHSASGRPCIGSDISGVYESIEDGETGYICKVRNSESLIDAVEHFINLPYKEKVAMGKAAREKMEREFDRNIVTNIYIEEINRILAKNE